MTSRDRELLNRWATDGDARAFDTLVSGYSGLVYSACRRISGNASDAEDAAQECFLQLAHKTPQIRTSLGAWLHTVATRQAINGIRRESRLKQREHAYSGSTRLSVEASWDDVQDFIDEALEALPDDLREPVVGSFLERKSHEVIAEEIGVDRSTVTRRIDKGIENVRGYLKEKGVIATSASLGALLSANVVEAVPAGLTVSLGKIAIAGESMAATEVFTGGGFLAGMSTGKAVVGLFGLVTLLVGMWAVRYEPTPDGSGANPSILERDLEVPVESQRGVAVLEVPGIDFDPLPETAGVAAVDDSEAGEEMSAAPGEVAEKIEIEEEGIVTKGVSGRVYDASNNAGLEDIGIQIFEGWESQVLLQSTNTGSNGHFSFGGLEMGRYRIVTDELTNYPEARRGGKSVHVLIEERDSDPLTQDIALEQGGVITGVAKLGVDPLPNTNVTVSSWSAGKNLDFLSFTTDSSGRYRIEGLPGFKGSVIGRRRQENGQSQDALVQAIEIEPGKETEVNFDFITGTGVIEGTVYFENTETPIEARLRVYFGWVQDGNFVEDVISAQTDENGYYVAEGLPIGVAEIHIFPKVEGGGIRRVETIKLSEGEHAHLDIIISSVSVVAEVSNIPVGTKELFIFAHPGETTVPLTNLSEFTALRDSMLAVSENQPGTNLTHTAVLKGLPPGRYTITASAWPARYSLATVQAYGMKKFFEDLRNVSTFVTVGDTDKEIEVELELPVR